MRGPRKHVLKVKAAMALVYKELVSKIICTHCKVSFFDAILYQVRCNHWWTVEGGYTGSVCTMIATSCEFAIISEYKNFTSLLTKTYFKEDEVDNYGMLLRVFMR